MARIGTEQIACFKGMMREFAISKYVGIRVEHNAEKNIDHITLLDKARDINSEYCIEWDRVRFDNVYDLFKGIVDDFNRMNNARIYFEKAKASYDGAIREYVNNDVEQTRKIYKQALNAMFGMRYGTLSTNYIPKIENVIFNKPATIVFWSDGTKTVVKAKDEGFDPEKGLAMAISKKALGNKHSYFDVFKKWIKKAYVKKYVKNNGPCIDIGEVGQKALSEIAKRTCGIGRAITRNV